MQGLAFDGKHLWVTEDTWPQTLICHKKTATLPVLTTFDIRDLGSASGITFDGKRLWIVSRTLSQILCMNVPPFQAAAVPIKGIGRLIGDAVIYGLTFDGKHLIVTQGWSDIEGGYHIEWLNPQTNTYIDYFNRPWPTSDLAFDGKYTWHTGTAANIVRCVNLRTRTEITSFAFTGPLGITFDGKYLWICDTENIYCVEKS